MPARKVFVAADSSTSKDKVAKLIATGKTSGKFRLGSTGLKEVPAEVYDQQPFPGVAFWEETAAKTLDVSRNELTSLPDGLSILAELESLNASYNDLSSLPKTLQALTSLAFLDISHNQIKTLPPALGNSLQSFLCGHNQLSEIGETSYPCLLTLSAEHNMIKKLPEAFTASSKLVKLSLAANQLSHFPQQLQGLQRLEELDLSGSTLEGLLSATISMLCSLKVLNLRQNRLSGIPPEISSLSHLAELNLGFNQLTELPPEIALLSHLHTLDLTDNNLESLPPEISRLSLGFLDLRNNHLASLPPQLGLMSSLKAMPVTGNPLRVFRPTILEGPLRGLLSALRHRLPEEEHPDNRGFDSASGTATPIAQALEEMRAGGGKSLCLSGFDLKELPQEVCNEDCSLLVKLDLSRNSLADLPYNRLAALQSLKILLLAGNCLTAWPLPVSGAPLYLTELDLSGYSGAIPQGALSSCSKSLTSLDLSGSKLDGQISSLGLDQCLQMKVLALNSCNLDTFPKPLLQLKSLESLSLASNKLMQIPDGISALSALTSLDLENNSIGALPPQLGLLRDTLRALKLAGNPLRSVRRPVLERGTKAVLECLRNRIPAQ